MSQSDRGSDKRPRSPNDETTTPSPKAKRGRESRVSGRAGELRERLLFGKEKNGKISKQLREDLIKFLEEVAEGIAYEEGEDAGDSGALLRSHKELARSQEEMMRTIADGWIEQRNTVRLLQTAVEELQIRIKEGTELARGKERPLIQAQKRQTYALVVESTKKGTTAEEVTKKLKAAVKPAEIGVRIESIREGHGSKILLKCRDEISVQKIKERMRGECKEISIRSPEPLKAVIAINGVDEEECKEGLVGRMIAQNPGLASLTPEGSNESEIIKVVRYAKMGVNKNTRRVFLMVNAEARKRLSELEYIYIGYKKVKVLDSTPLLQCYRCLGFNHMSKNCRNEERCMYCADGHRSSECTIKNEREKFKCYNCREYLGVKECNHRASSWECEYYKRMQVNVENRTVGIMKNSMNGSMNGDYSSQWQ